MDFSNFDESYRKLKAVLRDIVGRGKREETLKIYGAYLDYRGEIEVISERIETETEKTMKLSKRVFEALRRNEKVDDEDLIEDKNNILLIRLDIKSFFIFTRIFLDTLARIIKLYYGEKRNQLSPSMPHLLKKEKQKRAWKEIDYTFYKGLKERMRWMDDFKKTRDEIVHHLGSMRSTKTRDGKFGFEIWGLRNHRSWGTDTVESISEYMSDTLCHLSKAIDYIYNKFQSSALT